MKIITNFKSTVTLLIVSMTLSVSAQNSAVTKATTYQKSGKLQEAKELIDQAVMHEKSKTKAKTWYTKGLVYQSIALSEDEGVRALSPDAIKEAMGGFEKAKSLEKENGTYLVFSDQQIESMWGSVLNKGITHYTAKEYPDAIKYFDKAKLVKPTDTTAYLYAGISAQSSKMYDVALTNYKLLIDLGYDKVDIVHSIIYIERTINEDPQAALEYMQIARKNHPDNTDLQKEEINLLLITDQIDEAKGKLTKAIEAEPDNANLYYNLAFIHDQTDNRPGAIEAYKKAIELSPEYYDAIFNVAVMYYNSAADILKEANNMDLKTYQRKGKALEAEAKVEFEKALPYLEQANSLKAGSLTVLETLQIVYTQLKMNDKAEEVYNQIEKLDTGDTEVNDGN